MKSENIKTMKKHLVYVSILFAFTYLDYAYGETEGQTTTPEPGISN